MTFTFAEIVKDSVERAYGLGKTATPEDTEGDRQQLKALAEEIVQKAEQ